MFAKLSIWGLTPFVLGAFGLLAASSLNFREPALALTTLGVVVAVVVMPVAWTKRRKADLAWAGLGGIVSASVLGVVVLAPETLNNAWILQAPVPPADQSVRVVPRSTNRSNFAVPASGARSRYLTTFSLLKNSIELPMEVKKRSSPFSVSLMCLRS